MGRSKAKRAKREARAQQRQYNTDKAAADKQYRDTQAKYDADKVMYAKQRADDKAAKLAKAQEAYVPHPSARVAVQDFGDSGAGQGISRNRKKRLGA